MNFSGGEKPPVFFNNLKGKTMKKLAMSPIYKMGKQYKELEKNKINYIEGYIWCDKDQNNFTDGVLRYGQNGIFILCSFYKNAIGKIATIEVINRTKGNTIELKRFKILANRMLVKINEEKIFTSCDGKKICYFSIRMTVEKQTLYPDPQWIHQNLKIHFVVLIPKIMNRLGWKMSEKAQIEWFTEKGTNYPWEAMPKLDYYALGGLMHFEKFKEFYNEHINDWKNEKAIELLKERIIDMQKHEIIEFPTSNNPITEFGTFSGEIKEKVIKPEELNGGETTEKMPLFEKYYMQSMPYEESKFKKLDDFFGAVANCNIRFAAKGFLHYNNGKIKVEIKKIAVYVKDGFDYVGEQPLGSWSYKSMRAYKFGADAGISNRSYRDYRYDTKMGQDCYKYSNLYKYDVNYPLFYLK